MCPTRPQLSQCCRILSCLRMIRPQHLLHGGHHLSQPLRALRVALRCQEPRYLGLNHKDSYVTRPPNLFGDGGRIPQHRPRLGEPPHLTEQVSAVAG